jgi:hypothetical protein
MDSTTQLVITLIGFLVTFVASFFGAYFAFRYNYQMELKRDKRQVFQILMIYRNAWADEIEWIKTMNAVSVVFSREKRVLELYRTFLNQTKTSVDEQVIETYYQMLFQMAQCSGYKHLQVSDIKEFYNPLGLDKHYQRETLKNEPSASLPNVQPLDP